MKEKKEKEGPHSVSVILDHYISTVLLPVIVSIINLNLSFAYGTDREINTLVVLCRY